MQGSQVRRYRGSHANGLPLLRLNRSHREGSPILEQTIWTGRRVTALRRAYRSVFPELSDEEFAFNYLKVSPRTIYDWAQKPDTLLRPATQRLLKKFFEDAPVTVRQRYIELVSTENADVACRPQTASADTQWFSSAQMNALSASEDLDAMHAFRAADLQVGGGHLYASVVKYLKHNLAPRLFEITASVSTSALFGAASALSEMAGWMAHDAGRDSAARQHFGQALDYARFADDPQMRAHVLGSLTHLADHMGFWHDALKLAREGHNLLGGVSSPAVHARLLALEARAQASAGRSPECAKLLIAAETSLGQVAGDEPSVWVSHFDEASLASETVRSMRQLSQFGPAQRSAERIVELRKGRVRSHAFGLLGLAQILLTKPHPEPEEACAVASQVLDATESLSSYLVVAQFQALERHVLPFSSNAAVGAFHQCLVEQLRQRLRFHEWLAQDAGQTAQ
jgi:hypothetical protein